MARHLPLLVLLMFSAVAQAQFNYTIANGQVTITGYYGSSNVLNIPSTINGAPVTGIGYNAFYYRTSITSLTIPNSVTSIGDFAFISCSSLTNVTIPNSVTTIGTYAFYRCTSLSSVTLPNSVTSIGSGVFYGCTSLTSINVDALNSFYSSLNGVLFNKNQTTLIQYPSGKSGSYAIPNSVASIGAFAFASCRSLTSINVDALNSFYSSLNGVLFNKNQTTLIQYPMGKSGSYAIPNSVACIETSAFAGCSSMTSVTIPNSVTSIGRSAFYGCTGLANMTIPNSVTSIENNTFYGCTSLTGVTIPDGVTRIGAYAFSGCTGLTNVIIPHSVTRIEDYAFNYCSSLTNVTIPNSVVSIGYYAFNSCGNLKRAVFMGNAPTMGSNVFTSTASGFTAYYFNGATGFTSPWYGYTAVNMGDSSPIPPWLLSKGFAYNADVQSSPNGDGVSLLMAYALNLDPAQSQGRNLPRPVVSADQMSLAYYAGAEGVTYSVESSTDLQTWNTTGVTVSGPDANNLRTATVPATGPRRFMRLVVTR